MGEIDEPHHTEDQADAERRERVESAHAHHVDQGLDCRFHQAGLRSADMATPKYAASKPSCRAISSGGPVSVKVPWLITQARSAKAKARAAFCSTTSMATPRARIDLSSS